MKTIIAIFKTRRLIPLIIVLAIASILLSYGIYLSKPRLSPGDRIRDIEYLAQWAKDYSPFVELNEKLKDLPSYEALLPKYVKWAKQAEDDLEFARIAYGYASLIGASGHFYILPGEKKLWFFKSKAAYWHKLFHKQSIVYPPFSLIKIGNEYLTEADYIFDNGCIPQGSKILSVNGMSSQDYLAYLKDSTWVRFVAGRTENLDSRLLLVNEGKDFTGWKISFLLPNQKTLKHFVPTVHGRNPYTSEFIDISKGNCVCLSLTDDVGYIRLKSLAPKHVKPDRETIHAFFEESAGKYFSHMASSDFKWKAA